MSANIDRAQIAALGAEAMRIGSQDGYRVAWDAYEKRQRSRRVWRHEVVKQIKKSLHPRYRSIRFEQYAKLPETFTLAQFAEITGRTMEAAHKATKAAQQRGEIEKVSEYHPFAACAVYRLTQATRDAMEGGDGQQG